MEGFEEIKLNWTQIWMEIRIYWATRIISLFGLYLEFRTSDFDDLTAHAKLREFSLIQRWSNIQNPTGKAQKLWRKQTYEF